MSSENITYNIDSTTIPPSVYINERMEKIIEESPIVPDMEYIQCPYNSSHMILQHRFQIHLGRCRRNYSNVPKAICPFNVTHVLNKPELEWHVRSCENRASYEHYLHTSEADQKMQAPRFEVVASKTYWDDEPPVQTYDPQRYCITAPIFRTLQGASPAVKKKFRIDERKRLTEIKAKIERETQKN